MSQKAIRKEWDFNQSYTDKEAKRILSQVISGELVLTNISTRYIYETKDKSNNLHLGDRVVVVCWSQVGDDIFYGASIFHKCHTNDTFHRKGNRSTALTRLLRWPNKIYNTKVNIEELSREEWLSKSREERKEWSQRNTRHQQQVLSKVRENIFKQGVSSRHKEERKLLFDHIRNSQCVVCDTS